jgi:predicted transcriptional regulator
LDLPAELKNKIEQAARERSENPSSLIASAVDLLLEAEKLQLENVRRRVATRTGKTVANQRVMSWLDTWGIGQPTPPPQCE